MTYKELSVYGRLRKIEYVTSVAWRKRELLTVSKSKLGVYGMWEKLLHIWGDTLSPQEIYEKVRFFSWNYAVRLSESVHQHALTLVIFLDQSTQDDDGNVSYGGSPEFPFLGLDQEELPMDHFLA